MKKGLLWKEGLGEKKGCEQGKKMDTHFETGLAGIESPSEG
jgi:hypothetical protein